MIDSDFFWNFLLFAAAFMAGFELHRWWDRPPPPGYGGQEKGK